MLSPQVPSVIVLLTLNLTLLLIVLSVLYVQLPFWDTIVTVYVPEGKLLKVWLCELVVVLSVIKPFVTS